MKKSILIGLIALVVTAGHLSAQKAGTPTSGTTVNKTGETKGWPSKERYDFINECIKTASGGMGEDSARFYCYCMQEVVERKYPKIEDAANLTEEEMEKPEWAKQIKECLFGTWSSYDRERFLSDCIDAAVVNLSEEKATIYCECMMFKIEKMYPVYKDTEKLTEETLKSPTWQKIIKACLEF